MSRVFGRFAAVAGLLVVGWFALVSPATATTFNYTVYPSQVAPAGTPGALFSGDGSYNGSNAGPVTADPTTGAPGWGTSSFISNITGNPSATPGGTYTYSEFQLPNLDALFHTSTPLTIGDLAQISYYTKNNSGTNQDWDIRIYTVPQANDAHYYHARFESVNPTSTDSNWHMYNGDFTNVHSGVLSPAGMTNIDTPLANLSVSQLGATYGSQQILYMSFIAGASGNLGPISTNLDGIQITLTNGNVANINLAATPEPSSLVLGALGGAALLVAVRRRRRG